MDRAVPPICIDLGLNDYYDSFMGGLSKVSDKKRLKYIEEDHRKLHKDKINHIHLDASLDNQGG